MGLVEEQSVFLGHVVRLLEHAGDLGFVVTGGELFRTVEQQRIHVRNGRSKTMNSQHMKRLAIDLNFFRSSGGEPCWDKKALQPIGDFWEELDPANTWGGNWSSFKDTPHFERREGRSNGNGANGHAGNGANGHAGNGANGHAGNGANGHANGLAPNGRAGADRGGGAAGSAGARVVARQGRPEARQRPGGRGDGAAPAQRRREGEALRPRCAARPRRRLRQTDRRRRSSPSSAMRSASRSPTASSSPTAARSTPWWRSSSRATRRRCWRW